MKKSLKLQRLEIQQKKKQRRRLLLIGAAVLLLILVILGASFATFRNYSPG